MSTEQPLNVEGLRWQVLENTRQITELKRDQRKVIVIETNQEHLVRRVDSIYKLLWTVAGALVILTVSVLIAAAQVGGV